MKKLVLLIIVVSSIVIYGCTGKNIVENVSGQNNDMQAKIDQQAGMIK